MLNVEEKDANWLFSEFSESDLYSQKTKKEIKKIKECTKKHLKGEQINDLYKNIFYTRLKKILRRDKTQIKNEIKIKGPCFPGLNMFLMNSRGNFHICTMLDDSYSIGSVDDGLIKNRIKKTLKDIYDFVDLNCKNCWLNRICHPCIAKFNQKELLSQRPYVCFYRKAVYLELLKSYTKIYLK